MKITSFFAGLIVSLAVLWAPVNAMTSDNTNEFGGGSGLKVKIAADYTTIDDDIFEGILPESTNLTLRGEGLYRLTQDQTIGSLSGNGYVNLRNFTLTVGGNNLSTTYSGVISGTGRIVKRGTGNFTLIGRNTFTGGITVLEGSVNGSPTR